MEVHKDKTLHSQKTHNKKADPTSTRVLVICAATPAKAKHTDLHNIQKYIKKSINEPQITNRENLNNGKHVK